jgi:hypothetical protein
MLKVLNQLTEVEGDKKDPEIKAFTDVIGGIRKFAGHAEKTLDTVIKAEENWFLNNFIKLLK